MSTIWAELAQWICSPPYDTRRSGSGGRTLLLRRFVLHLTASARKIGQPLVPPFVLPGATEQYY